jgi:hypothetical protein
MRSMTMEGFTQQIRFVIAVNTIVKIIANGFLVNANSRAAAKGIALWAILMWLANVLVLSIRTITNLIASERGRYAAFIALTIKFR